MLSTPVKGWMSAHRVLSFIIPDHGTLCTHTALRVKQVTAIVRQLGTTTDCTRARQTGSRRTVHKCTTRRTGPSTPEQA